MDEKYLEYKKSKTYKKRIFMNIILFLLFIAIVVCSYYFYQAYNKDDIIYDENKNYTYEIKENTLYLNSESGIEQTYKCLEECDFYTTDNNEQYYEKGKVLLQDGEYIYLYNLLRNSKSDNFYNLEFILDEKNEKPKLFKVTDYYDKVGIIDLNGNVLISPIYNELGNLKNGKLTNYSFEKNYITAKRGDKWGMVSLNNGKGLIDFQYDEIKISPYNKLAVKEGKLWYLVDNMNKRVIHKGFDSIDIYEEYVLISENRELYLVNLLGNIMSNKLVLYFDEGTGYTSYFEDEVLYVLVDRPVVTGDDEVQKIKYFYDVEEKEFFRSAD